jgi:hypothetical protein
MSTNPQNAGNIDPKQLCLRLLHADTESEVTAILEETGFLKDPSAWTLLGGTDSNVSIVNNQQAHPAAALVEKIINSVDAVLTDACLRQGIEPTSPEAPRSINEASEKFFKIPKGFLQNVTPEVRTELAERIALVATGTVDEPCYNIIDAGEGQSPSKFPLTLCSLPTSKAPSYKSRVRFVQGIYNMGGSGVLRFCGKKHYQLIISKRDPDLPKDATDNTLECWGFTIVRREFPIADERSSRYKYLTPNGNLLMFKRDELHLKPGDYPKPYEKPMKWGTCIKLYNYDLQPRALRTMATLDLYYELSQRLYTLALPFRIYECRPGYTGHTPEVTLSGMSVRIEEDRAEAVEDNFPAGGPLLVQNLGELKVWICAFKRESGKDPQKRRRWFGSGDKAILFVVNGQMHAYLESVFFKRERVNLNYLAKDLMVIVDCSLLPPEKRENLFMASRERLSDSTEKELLVSKLEEYLGDHAGLKELNQKRWQEEVQSQIGDDKPLKMILDKLIKTSPSLSVLFSSGNEILEPKSFEWIQVNTSYKGKRFPTFFRIKEEPEGGLIKAVPRNRSCIINFETDAENNYFSRQNDPGVLSLSIPEVKESLSLWNGIASLRLKPTTQMQPGETLEIKTEVSDPTRDNPLGALFKMNILNDGKRNSHKGGPGKKNEEEEKEGRKKKFEKGEDQGLNLPRIHEVLEKDWSGRDPPFDKFAGLELIPSPGGDWDAYVNMDNCFLVQEIMNSKGEDPKLLKQQFKYGLVLVAIAMLHHFKEQTKKPPDQTVQEEEKNGQGQAEALKKIREASGGVSMVILPIIKSLGRISKSTVD